MMLITKCKTYCVNRITTWDLFPTGTMPLWIALLILLLAKVSSGTERVIDIVTTLLTRNIKL